jgi:hypothetical protein
VKHGEILWWFGSWYSILLVPLSFMAKLLQGSTWTGWVTRYIPWSRYCFQKTIQFSKMSVPPLTQLELFSHGFEEHEGELVTSSLASTVTRSEHHWTTLVSFGD